MFHLVLSASGPWSSIFLVGGAGSSGGLVGEIAGYFWQPYGGGTSIALFGLLGGLILLMFRRGGPLQVIASLYALMVVTALTCEAVVTAPLAMFHWLLCFGEVALVLEELSVLSLRT